VRGAASIGLLSALLCLPALSGWVSDGFREEARPSGWRSGGALVGNGFTGWVSGGVRVAARSAESVSVALPPPLLHLKFDDNAADTVVLNSVPGSGQGIAPRNTGVMHTSGASDGAFTFDSDGVKVVPYGLVPPLSAPLTYSAWVKTTAFTVYPAVSTLIGAVGDEGVHGGIALGLDDSGRPFFTVYGGEGQALCKSAVTLDAWNLVTVTYSEDGVVAFYIDGVFQNSLAYELPIEPTSGDVYVGGMLVPAWGGWVLLLQGSIDDARIYGVALSASEVQALYVSYGFEGAGSVEITVPENVVVYTSYGWPSEGDVSAYDADWNVVPLTLDGQSFYAAAPESVVYLYNYDGNGGEVNTGALPNLVQVFTN